MKEIKINEDQEFITLAQLLKITGVISTGGQAKWYLSEHILVVNDENEQRRGRKLYEGDRVDIEEYGTFIIKK